jgi:hypothetical protein
MLPLRIYLWTAAFDTTHILAAFVGLPLRAPFHTVKVVPIHVNEKPLLDHA